MADEQKPLEVSSPSSVATPETSGVEPAASVDASSATPIPEVKTEAVPEVVKAETPEAKVESTALGAKPEEKKPEEPKKVEAAKTDDAKPEEVKSEALPTFEWKFPEGVTVDKEQMGAVNKVFGELEREAKVPHEVMEKYGQQLADFHVSQINEVAKRIADNYAKTWNDNAQKMMSEFESDPEIGGNRRDTTLSAARAAIKRFGGNEDQQQELRQFFDQTKTGNFKGLIRLLANINTGLREPTAVPATKAVPESPKGLKQKMYGVKRK